jgi:hypothetical protein
MNGMPVFLNPDGTPRPMPVPTTDWAAPPAPISVDTSADPMPATSGADLRAQVAGGGGGGAPGPGIDPSWLTPGPRAPQRPFGSAHDEPPPNAAALPSAALPGPASSGADLARQIAADQQAKNAAPFEARAHSAMATPYAPAPVVTYPGAAAPPGAGAPGAPAAATQEPPPATARDLYAMYLGRGGGGGAGGKVFNPYEERDKAAKDALQQEFALRDQRQDNAYRNHDELAQEASAMQRYADEAKARGESQSQEARGQEGAFLRAADEAAADRINPNHYKETRGAMQAGLDVLAAAFGGLAAGARGGGPNRGIDHLNAKIGADIDAQKANHSIKVEGVDAKKTAYGMMLDRFHNDDVAANAAHVAELDKWKALGDARAALDDNVESQAKWVQRREELLARRAEYADAARLAAYKASLGPDKLAELKRLLELQKVGAEIAHVQAETGKLGAETGKIANEAGAAGGLPDKDRANIFRDPQTGAAYVAPNPEARKKAADVVDRERRIQGLADQYAAQIADLGAGSKLGHKVGFNSTKMAAAQSTYATLSAEIRQANNEGVWKKSEQELIANQLPPPDQVLNGRSNALAVTSQVKATSQQALDRTLRAQGATPVQEGMERDARGNLHPVARYAEPSAPAPKSGAELRAQVTGKPASFEAP